MRRQIYAEELDLVYRLIGRSLWQLQNVEDALQNMLAMREIGEPGSVDNLQRKRFFRGIGVIRCCE